MIERYFTAEMSQLWSEETKFKYWLLVESAVAKAQAQLGIIPQTLFPKLNRVKINVPEIETIEKTVQHDVIAFLKSIEKQLGKDAQYLHFGLTSYDIVDTALSLRCLRACNYILEKLHELAKTIKKLAIKHKFTLMIGRTHGVHAQPITFGVKCLAWYQEIQRNILRIETTRKNLSYGKISGAVGVYTELNPQVELIALKRLGLKPEPISTQIIPRDRYAELLTALAILAAGLERIATEIRNLQRTEIGELAEPFGKAQRGSSAMPHKKNPIICERICSLARLVRSYVPVGLENVVQWHERDLTNSANERIIIPSATSLVHYMIIQLNKVLAGLVVDTAKMKENLDKSKEQFFSQSLMMALIKKGVARDQAYALVQRLAFQAKAQDEYLSKIVLDDKEAGKLFTEKEIKQIFSYQDLAEKINFIYKRVLKKKPL
ncbi:MAG: adenylosuccinate lyase [candidate division WOR-3 bacterium]|nr:adenylosuccinate lyase [candidate division WOR-3 bacterium]